MAAAASNVLLISLSVCSLAFLLARITLKAKPGASNTVSMAGIVAGIVAVVAAAIAVKDLSAKKHKQRGALVELAGDDGGGITYRNSRFLSLVEDCDGAVTITALFEQACTSKFPHHPLLGSRDLVSREVETGPDGRAFEKVHLGEYVWQTYEQVFLRVNNFASGLAAIGHGKGERVAIFAETRAEWLIAAQGCFRRNVPVVTIYASLGEEALAFSLNETEVTTIICDWKQLAKALGMCDQLHSVRRVVYMEDAYEKGQGVQPPLTGRSAEWTVLPFSEVEALGQQTPVEPDLPGRDDVAVIMYTSGSTGMPKGVVMSHGNIVSTIGGVSHLVPQLGPSDVYIAYLPLAHVMELVAEVTMCIKGAAIGYGSPLTLTDTASKIKQGTKGDASELKPTLMTAVPAILDRVRDGVRKKVDAKGGLAKSLFNLAYNRRLAAIEGSWLGAWGLEKVLWDALVFKKIRALLGGRVRGLLSGGAPLSGDTQRFINVSFGTPIGQGYGLTETCSGGTFGEWDDLSVGRVGPPVPHCYIKLVNWEEGGYLTTDSPLPRGEIVIGGPSVTVGYFKNQAKTDEVYKVDPRGNRWFFTGDIGRFHSDGCMEIVDRKKDIVKLQHGEYVSLGKVEAILVVSSYVDNIMLHADPSHSSTVALVVAAEATLGDWAKKANIQFQNLAELCCSKEAAQEVLRSLSQIGKQAKLQRFEIPTKIKLLPDPWTPETGYVTAALKLKREVVKKAFADDLKVLYA